MSKKISYFGLTPEQVGGKIPCVVKKLIEDIKKLEYMTTTGIFRLNGNNIQTSELIEQIDTKLNYDSSNITDIHTFTSALKRYFRTMSEKDPLFTFDLYYPLIKSLDGSSDENSINNIKNVLKNLSLPRRQTVAYLCTFLFEISTNSQMNQMAPSNLSICIAPNLIVGNNKTDPNFMGNTLFANKVFEMMIQYHELIFDDIQITDELFCTEEDLAMMLIEPLDIRYVKDLVLRHKMEQGFITPVIAHCEYSKLPQFSPPTRNPPPIPAGESELNEDSSNTLSPSPSETNIFGILGPPLSPSNNQIEEDYQDFQGNDDYPNEEYQDYPENDEYQDYAANEYLENDEYLENEEI